MQKVGPHIVEVEPRGCHGQGSVVSVSVIMSK